MTQLSSSPGGSRGDRLESLFSAPVIAAALLTVPVIVLQESRLAAPWGSLVDVLNWATWLVFVTEVCVMLAVADDRRRWMRDHATDVLLVVLTPPVFPPGLQFLRALPLLRVLRALRVAAAARRVVSLEGLRFAAVAAVIVAVGGAAAFQEAEGAERGLSLGDSLWWAVTTMTTVGYGDVTPATGLGRIVSVAVMLVGIGFIALLTGAVAQYLFSSKSAPAASVTDETRVLAELESIARRLDTIEARLFGSVLSRGG